MNVIEFILLILCAYFLLVFVGLRLIVPYMGFRQYVPPTTLPLEVKNKISELEILSSSPEDFLEKVYNFVLRNWRHTRGQAVLHLHKLFLTDLEKIWHTQSFIYCHTMNFVAFTMLSNSKFFNISDVKIRHVFLNFVPHQYLQVKVGEKWVDFDPAGVGIRGKGLGKHISFFG